MWEGTCTSCSWREVYGTYDAAADASRRHTCDYPRTEVRPMGDACWGDLFGQQ